LQAQATFYTISIREEARVSRDRKWWEMTGRNEGANEK
jgi:hypothetical protein